jgi:hypothetical protein
VGHDRGLVHALEHAEAIAARSFHLAGEVSSLDPGTLAVRPANPESRLYFDDVRVLRRPVHAVRPVNPAIFPGDDFGEPGDVLVELIAGTNKRDTVVLGKHVRVVIGGDGVVRSVKALSNGVLEVPTREGEKRPVSLFVSEVVDDYPLEIHVFASMSSHLPLYVTNARGLWFVDGDQITFLGKQQ